MCFLFPLTQRVWWVCLVLYLKKNFVLWLCGMGEELGHVEWHSYLP